jgi:hypothetical protein
MPGSINWLEELILDQRIRLKINPVLISASHVGRDRARPFDNRWFSKRKATQRIDPLVSLAMAVGAAMSAAAKVTSVYEAARRPPHLRRLHEAGATSSGSVRGRAPARCGGRRHGHGHLRSARSLPSPST